MFCARCGQQIPGATDICPLCGQEATLTLDSPPAVLATPAFLQASTEQRTPDFRSYAPRELQGIGGWLLFFLVGLTVLSPLLVILPFLIAQDFSAGRLVDVAVTCLGLTAALFLWRESPAGLDLLRIYFGIVAVLAILGLIRIGTLPGGISQHASSVGSLVRSLVYVGLWVLYFRNSIRIHATYGRNF